MTPTVSAIIPAYNVAHCLGQAVDSALAQESASVEVLVINDGSTDQTEAVARSYGGRVRYLEQENQGQGAARNLGLRHAMGRYVAFLDADDYWAPSFLRTCVGFLEQHEEAVAVSTAFLVRRWGREVLGPGVVARSPRGSLKPRVLESFFDFWGREDHVRTGTVVIRRETIDRAGFQNAELRISQDLEYWGYVATFGRWGFVPEPLWIGNSVASAARQGWRRHYESRRRLCPTVHQWQARIVPRLGEKDWPGFRLARGRVACNYAHSKVLAGDDSAALDIVREFGTEFPAGQIGTILRCGARCGWPAWGITCRAIRFRERVKGCLVGRLGALRGKAAS
jgi:glycosyltransferase involved in cell wall biosynthesis